MGDQRREGICSDVAGEQRFNVSHPSVHPRAASQTAWSLFPLGLLLVGLGQTLPSTAGPKQLRVLDRGIHRTCVVQGVHRMAPPSLLQARVV